MIGLGCGARSYAGQLHYSTDYAVGSAGVREIIASYLGRSDGEFRHADYGCEIGMEDQRRRWVIKSLLRASGFDLSDYRRAFGTACLEDFPELSTLIDAGYAQESGSRVRPTAKGLEWSDAIGPSLFSDRVNEEDGRIPGSLSGRARHCGSSGVPQCGYERLRAATQRP